MNEIIVTVRFRSKEGLAPALAIGATKIVVCAYDFLNDDGSLNDDFYMAHHIGGIHRFLKFNGEIILSLVMRDQLILNTKDSTIIELIDGLAPDKFTSFDCETYEGEYTYSKIQLLECSKKTVMLARLFTSDRIIGLVKGCSREQILEYYDFLNLLGIKTFILHAADFFRNGNERLISKLKYYATLIKKDSNIVFLHGFGSQKRLEEFSFLDGYITYSHVVNSQRGLIFQGRKRQRRLGPYFVERSINNLKQIVSNLKDSKSQTKLFGGEEKWVVASELQPELIIQGKY